MKAFLVANPKGGSGKSTLATNLAGYFASKRHEVMLGDIDRQQSSREWLGLRPFALPTIDTWEIGLDAVARPPKGTSHVILDTPGGLHGRMLERVLKLSTRVIVPVQPSIFGNSNRGHMRCTSGAGNCDEKPIIPSGSRGRSSFLARRDTAKGLSSRRWCCSSSIRYRTNNPTPVGWRIRGVASIPIRSMTTAS